MHLNPITSNYSAAFHSRPACAAVVVVGGITVVVVTVTTATGRRANKKIYIFTLWPIIPQRIQGFFLMMSGKPHFVFRFTIFVTELVMVNSKSISSFVVEFTVVKLPVTFITVVVVPSFIRKTWN